LTVYRYPERFNPKKPGEILGWDSVATMKFDGKNRYGIFTVETFHSVTYKNDDAGRAVGNLSETMTVKYLDEAGKEISVLL
jgi:translation elongation factor P/translation initiation factor 5A